MFTRKYVKTGIVVALGAVVCVPSWADEGISQIHRLMQEKQQKYAQLEECSKKVEGFKIAGISTLGLTAIGIGANVALVNKQDKLKDQIVTTKKSITNREQQLVKLNEQIADARVEKAKRDAEEAERKRNEQAIEAQRQAACIGPSVRWNYTTKNCECADPLAFWNADKNACERPVEQKQQTATSNSGSSSGSASSGKKPEKPSSGGDGGTSTAKDGCVKNIQSLVTEQVATRLVVYNSTGSKVEIPAANTEVFNKLSPVAKKYSGTPGADAQKTACDDYEKAKLVVDEVFKQDKCVHDIQPVIDEYQKIVTQYGNVGQKASVKALAVKIRDDGVLEKDENATCTSISSLKTTVANFKKQTVEKVGNMATGAMAVSNPFFLPTALAVKTTVEGVKLTEKAVKAAAPYVEKGLEATGKAVNNALTTPWF